MAAVVDQSTQVSVLLFGDTPNALMYVGQTFTAPTSPLSGIEFALDWEGGLQDAVKFRVLLTTLNVALTGQITPGTILFESNTLSLPIDNDSIFTTFSVNLPNVALTPGQPYAFILDAFADTDSVRAWSRIALSHDGVTGSDYTQGIAIGLFTSTGDRSTHFMSDWGEFTQTDLAFKLIFAPDAVDDIGVTNEDTVLIIPVANLLANDANNPGSITSVGGVAGGTVRLDGTNIVFTPTPNHNGVGSFSYTIEDSFGFTDTATVSLIIPAVDDAPGDLALSNARVPENARKGFVVGALTPTDPDGERLSFTLLDNAGGRFTVNGNTLVVADGIKLDFEQRATHKVVVSAADPNGLTRLETLSITVRNVDPENVAGTARADIIFGGALNDRLKGVGGNDTLRGLARNDILDGGLGNDRLDGGAGIDILVGGRGKDVLIGGLGRDVFDFNAISESVRGANRDTVFFRRVDGDKIDLRTIDADSDTAGNQAFAFIGSAAFSGGDGELRLAGGVLQGDVNGNRLADLEIRVSGALLAGDVLL